MNCENYAPEVTNQTLDNHSFSLPATRPKDEKSLMFVLKLYMATESRP
jgi:hypothetical protein